MDADPRIAIVAKAIDAVANRYELQMYDEECTEAAVLALNVLDAHVDLAAAFPATADEAGAAIRSACGGPQTCLCPIFRDTGGFRIADLGCPIHGVGGTDPGDGPRRTLTPPPATTENQA